MVSGQNVTILSVVHTPSGPQAEILVGAADYKSLSPGQAFGTGFRLQSLDNSCATITYKPDSTSSGSTFSVCVAS
jgi:hypothetical protein